MTCLECGKAVPSKRATFCSTPCKTLFHRRRQMRGAVLYDFIMARYHDPGLANDLGINHNFLRHISELFRAEDERERRGRPSWQDPKQALEAYTAKVKADR